MRAMSFCRKHFALLAALLLLCGCTNNGGSSVTETEPTAENSAEVNSTAETTGEIMPEQGGASQEAAPEAPAATGVPGGEGVPAQNPGGGVDLVSGGYSENSLIFDLEGTYCDISELPFSIKTYSLPPDAAKLNFERFGGGRLYFTDYIYDEADVVSAFTLYAFDLETGELTEEYSGEGRYVFADDRYVVTKNEASGVTSVIRLSNGNTVYEYNNDDGYFSTFSGEVVIVYDTMYYDALHKLPDFDISIPMVMTVNLLTGERSLYDINVGYPSNGTGGVVFMHFCDDMGWDGSVNIRGDSYPHDSSSNFKWNLEGSFPIKIDSSYENVLGSRNKLSWINNANEPIRIGTTGFRIEPAGIQISKDGLFVLDLVKFEDTDDDPFTSRRWRVIGCYDGKTSQNVAAINEYEWKDEELFTDQGKIYIVNIPELEIKVVSKE